MRKELEEKAYEIIGKSFIDYWKEELKIVEEDSNIILIDNGKLCRFDTWEDFCDEQGIISCDKVYNLSFDEEETKVVNELLKSLNMELLEEE